MQQSNAHFVLSVVATAILVWHVASQQWQHTDVNTPLQAYYMLFQDIHDIAVSFALYLGSIVIIWSHGLFWRRTSPPAA